MKKFCALFLVLILLLTACNGKKNSEPEVTGTAPTVSTVTDSVNEISVIVTEVQGEAIRSNNSSDLEDITVNMKLVENDFVITGEDAVVIIDLGEGKQVYIGANTVFALSALRRDSDGNVTILSLKQGCIANVIDKPLEENDCYEVATPRLVMSVRGTSNMMYSGEDGDKVAGITGDTRVNSDKNGTFRIIPGMALDANTSAIELVPFEPSDLPDFIKDNYTSKRNIDFKALSMEEINAAQNGAGDNMNWFSLGKQEYAGVSSAISKFFKDEMLIPEKSLPPLITTAVQTEETTENTTVSETVSSTSTTVTTSKTTVAKTTTTSAKPSTTSKTTSAKPATTTTPTTVTTTTHATTTPTTVTTTTLATTTPTTVTTTTTSTTPTTVTTTTTSTTPTTVTTTTTSTTPTTVTTTTTTPTTTTQNTMIFSITLNQEENGFVLKEYKGTGKDVVIPAVIGGLPVVRISSNTFTGNTVITSVTIPESVTTIDNGALKGIKDLIIYGKPGSAAEVYAEANSITFVAI